ncbi:MAG: hypothetical protein P8Y60_13305, partial [Calditrichota bacterium]
MSLYFKIKRNLFPIEEGVPGFTPQFRLEGRSRDGDDDSGLEMRIADPLWMLGRQWQFGEFKGEDNGSPIGAHVNYRKEKINFYSFQNSGVKQELGPVPLEARVEAVEMKPMDLRSKVRIGQKFEELIRAHFQETEADDFIVKLRTEYPLNLEGKPDQKSRTFFYLVAGNVIDGGTLWREIQANAFPRADFLPLETVTRRLINWYQDLFLPAQEES